MGFQGRKMIFGNLNKSKKVITVVFVVFFSIFGIQSSYADYYPSGPQQNVSEQTLRNNGWTLFYEQTYGTKIDSITQIRPSGQYVILSGKAVGSSNILLAAAAPTSQVFTETVRNTPQLLNGAYWYLTLGIGSWGNPEVGSIGFAPTSDITQDQADTNSGEQRLSWHVLSNHAGGYRIGNTISLNSSTDYLKQVWTWNGPTAPAPAPVYVRQTSNLTFAQSLYGSDTLSDPDGELRKTVDQIMAKYGSLIK
jgi:hypothetical protein